MQYSGAISKMTEWSHIICKAIHSASRQSTSIFQPLRRSWSWMILWRPTRLPKTKTKKRCLFHHGDWNANVGSQEIPAIISKFGFGVQNEAGQRLTEFSQENVLVLANTLFQQHKMTVHMNITRWSIMKSDWLYSLQPKVKKLYTVSKNKTRSWLWLRSWTPYCKIQIYI